MKILHIHFGKEGGAERFFTNLVGALHERGVEQRVLIRPGRSWRSQIEKVATVYEGVFRRVSLSRFVLAFRLRRILKEFQPDVIVTWQLRASRFMPNYTAAKRISRLGDYPEHLEYYKNSEILVCITPDMAESVRRLGWIKRIEVIPNFSNAAPGPAIQRSELATPDNAFVVVAMGRFVKRKGFDYLIRAVAKVDNAYLWLLGDGPEREALELEVKALGLQDRIKLPGWKTDAYSYLAAADVFAITSLHEPLGNVCFEGWGAQKATISSRAEGPSWVMTHESDALMVDCADDVGLAAAIARLRDDPVLRERLVQGGQETLKNRFSKEIITSAYMELFSEPKAKQ